jgi:hypothetical protein
MIPGLYPTQMFIAVFRRAHHWVWYRAQWNQCTFISCFFKICSDIIVPLGLKFLSRLLRFLISLPLLNRAQLMNHHNISITVDSTWVFRVAGAAISDMSPCSLFRVWYMQRALSRSATEVFDLSLHTFGLCSNVYHLHHRKYDIYHISVLYRLSWFDVCGSVHHSTIYKEKSNKVQQCIKILLFRIYMKLNMFWATHRPSSGA